MRNSLLPSLVVLCLAAALGGCRDRDALAVVGDTVIRQPDLDLYRQMRSNRDPAESLQALVDRNLLAEGARKQGLDADPVVQARIAAAKREILAQATLEAATRRASDEQALRERYQADKEKLTRLQIHVAQIAVRAPPELDAKARLAAQTKINALYARVTGGEPFDEVARAASEDPVSAARGGDLGPVLKGQTNDDFFSAAAALKKGETSKPITTAFGFHVLRALEDPKPVTIPFQEARGVLAADLRREAEAARLEELRKTIRVTVHQPKGRP